MLSTAEIICAVEIEKWQCQQQQPHQDAGIEPHFVLVDIMARSSSIIGFDRAFHIVHGKYCDNLYRHRH